MPSIEDTVREERDKIKIEAEQRRQKENQMRIEREEVILAQDRSVKNFWAQLLEANSNLDEDVRLVFGRGQLATYRYFPADGEWSFTWMKNKTEWIGIPRSINILFLKEASFFESVTVDEQNREISRTIEMKEPSSIHFGVKMERKLNGNPITACVEPDSEWNSASEKFYRQDTLAITSSPSFQLTIQLKNYNTRILPDSLSFVADQSSVHTLLRNMCMPGVKNPILLSKDLIPLDESKKVKQQNISQQNSSAKIWIIIVIIILLLIIFLI
jgi:hypothetical protein